MKRSNFHGRPSCIVSICFLFFCTASFAQQFEVSYSPEYPYELKPTIHGLIKVGDSFYSMVFGDYSPGNYGGNQRRFQGGDKRLDKMTFNMTLNKLGPDMEKVEENKLAEGKKAFGPYDPVFRIIDGRLYFIYSELTDAGGPNSFHFMAASVDTASLELGKPVELLLVHQANADKSKHIRIDLDNDLLHIAYSPDGSKILFIWEASIDQEVFMSVTNKKLERIWTGKQALPHAEETMPDVIVDNKGNIYAAFIYTVKNNGEAYLRLYRPDASVVEKTLDPGANRPCDLHMAPLKDGKKIVMAGLYARQGAWRSAGAYSMNLSTKDLGLDQPVITPYPASLVKQLDRDDCGSDGKDAGANPINLLPAVLPDGSLTLFNHFTTNVYSTKSQYIAYRDVFIAHFTPAGAVFGLVPMYHIEPYGLYSNFAMVRGRQTIVFYCEDEDNFQRRPDQKPEKAYGYSNWSLQAAVMESDGTLRKVKVEGLSEDRFVPDPNYVQVLDDSTFIIPTVHYNARAKAVGIKWATVHIK